MLKAELLPRFSVDGGAQAGGFFHHEKELSCPVKGNGPLRMSEASGRLSFFLFFFFFFCSGASLPLRKSPALLTGISAFQGEPPVLEMWFPARAEARLGGVQIKAGFEMSLIFGMLLRV